MAICDRIPRRFFPRHEIVAAFISVLGLALSGSAAATSAAEKHPALSPEEALARFQIEPGLRIELVAAEPLVVDPVAFALDPAGRL